MRRGTALVASVAALALLVAACSEDEPPTRQEMIDQTSEKFGYDEATATCLVDGLLDEVGAERLEEILGEIEEVEDLTDDELESFAEAQGECLDTGDMGEGPGVTLDSTTTTTAGE